MIEQAYASAGHLGADRVWLVRSVQSEISVLIAAIKIKGSRPQRIADAARQSVDVVRIDRHSANHVCGRRPVRPFGLSADDGRAAKVKRFLAADAHGVAGRDAGRLEQIQPPLGDVDNDRPGPVGAGEGDLLAKQAGIDPGEVKPGGFVPMVEDRAIGGRERGVMSGRSRPGSVPARVCAAPEQARDSANTAPANAPGHPAISQHLVIEMGRALSSQANSSRPRQRTARRRRPERLGGRNIADHRKPPHSAVAR